MGLKFNQKTIDKVHEDTRDRLKILFASPALLSSLGDEMIKDLKFQARRGKNSLTGGNFIPLSKEWIEMRGRLEESNATNQAYKQARSNVTFTGQLLDSISKRIKGKAIQLYFDGVHRPYKIKTKSGIKTTGKPISNDQLAQYVGEIRPFFYLRETLLPKLKNIVISYIRRKL